MAKGKKDADKPADKPVLPMHRPEAMTEERLAALARGRAARAVKTAAAREARENGEETRYQLFRQGKLQVAEWDDEELSKCALKDRGGGFNGAYLQRFTGQQHSAVRRELLRRGQMKMEEAYFDILKSLKDIATGAIEDKDRVRASHILLERIAGKVPDRVEIGGVDAFADVLAGIIDDGVLKDVPADGPEA